jgi:molybdopterin-guanine dinucleotide biosynthesis protein A
MSATSGQGTVGVLLAGGQSRRMFAEATGQGDKGLLDLGGRPMISHVIERLAPQVASLVVNANGDPARFELFGLPVVADTLGGYVGPLAGVLAGLRWAVANRPGARYVVTVSTDAPFLPRDLVRRLAGALDGAPHGERIALARSGGHLHPVIGLWPVALADDLETALRDGVRKVLAWTDRHGTLGVDFADEIVSGHAVDPFFNANTPAELEEARRLVDF